ncbi:hypothetical protein MED121_18545 [Marinomonas sp. MED121]|uniref:helix-turn-helix domain-containing protein n=1 Tax=Marinomonas sp. MED121 TaxID=314277 RepID=UPI0000690D45|nr:helix-turn-helix transcriptional regulator [Marinomonas sp. MED121]EAQ65268.1 hypothetical protein MED121_18545 [Marinomonas sp. MED121]
MNLLSESDVVKLALKKSTLSQKDFSKKLGKSQAQISKYISGESNLSAKTYIHCMNILSQLENDDDSLILLLKETSRLKGEKHKEIRKALIDLIKAYSSNKDLDNDVL